MKNCANIERGRSSIASLRSDLEQNEVTKRLGSSDSWIGAVEIGTSGHWFWWSSCSVGGPSEITKAYWALGEPSNSGQNEGCAVIGWSGGKHKKWVDLSCQNKVKAICELRC